MEPALKGQSKAEEKSVEVVFQSLNIIIIIIII